MPFVVLSPVCIIVFLLTIVKFCSGIPCALMEWCLRLDLYNNCLPQIVHENSVLVGPCSSVRCPLKIYICPVLMNFPHSYIWYEA